MKILHLFLVILGVYTTKGDYIGAVVEYNPITLENSASLTVETNVGSYIHQIGQAKTASAQIIVFPEYGLTGLVDDPENYAITIPQVGTSNFSTDATFSALQSLSNAALEHQMYVVVNLLEKETISTTNSTLYYNTNVVFASNGTLIAKYRKINLFGEPKLTAGTNLTIFTTDFGTFAVITCMDILYYNPSQTVLKDSGVDTVIFSAAWNSIAPFYISVEVQLGYAIANKVNLLAANLNSPTDGRGGSTIISSNGVLLRKFLTDQPQSKLLYADIQTTTSVFQTSSISRGFDILDDKNTVPFSNYKNTTDFDYASFTFTKLDLSVENITEEICHSDFCCSFNIVAFQNETNTTEVYQLVAYTGPTKFDTETVNIKFCALVACLTENTASCGLRPTSPYTTVFRQLVVWQEWQSHSEEFYRPVSFRGNLDSIYNATYTEVANDDIVAVSYNTTVPENNVVLFGVYVRAGAAIIKGGSLMFLAAVVMAQAFF